MGNSVDPYESKSNWVNSLLRLVWLNILACKS